MNIETKNLWKKNANEILTLIDKKEISLEEVLESSLNRIKEINPDINAVVTLINDDKKKRLICFIYYLMNYLGNILIGFLNVTKSNINRLDNTMLTNKTFELLMTNHKIKGRKYRNSTLKYLYNERNNFKEKYFILKYLIEEYKNQSHTIDEEKTYQDVEIVINEWNDNLLDEKKYHVQNPKLENANQGNSNNNFVKQLVDFINIQLNILEGEYLSDEERNNHWNYTNFNTHNQNIKGIKKYSHSNGVHAADTYAQNTTRMKRQLRNRRPPKI